MGWPAIHRNRLPPQLDGWREPPPAGPWLTEFGRFAGQNAGSDSESIADTR